MLWEERVLCRVFGTGFPALVTGAALRGYSRNGSNGEGEQRPVWTCMRCLAQGVPVILRTRPPYFAG